MLPSAEALGRIASGGVATSASFDIPRALLNPLRSMERALSLDEVKARHQGSGEDRGAKADKA
ncbi:MAG: hypothetical protein ABWY78_03015 [Microvirga sp.]